MNTLIIPVYNLPTSRRMLQSLTEQSFKDLKS